MADVGSLYHRFDAILEGRSDEPESKFVEDLRRFIEEAKARQLGGTLMKAENLLKKYERFRELSASVPDRNAIKHCLDMY